MDVFHLPGMVSGAVLAEDWTLVINGGRLSSGARHNEEARALGGPPCVSQDPSNYKEVNIFKL